LEADYVTVVEDRPIMSAKYRLPVKFFFAKYLTKTVPRSSRMVSLQLLPYFFLLIWTEKKNYYFECPK